MKIRNKSLLIVAFACLTSLSVRGQNEFLVCGDSKVLLVDYKQSKDSIPHIKWEWDAAKDSQLPEDYRNGKFRTMDDCKMAADGQQVLVSSSSGGVALLGYPDKKLLFLAEVGNAHSIALLPGGLIAVAASTHPKGNKVVLYHASRSNEPLAEDSLYSGHGVVWHPQRKLLYALGYDVLRAYTVDQDPRGNVTLSKKSEWPIPGKSGHDLFLTPDGRQLYITEHTQAWAFDLTEETFGKITNFPAKENIKSLGHNQAGQLLFTEPEESWWTFSVKFINPDRKFVFPGMKVYKARWATH